MCGRDTILTTAADRNQLLVTLSSEKQSNESCELDSENHSRFREGRQCDITGTEKLQREIGKKAKACYVTRPRSFDCIRVMFRESLSRLEDSGWYWGHISQNEAKLLLKSSQVGTFLIRDSSDARYLFSLSVRSQNSITNVRVLFNQGHFMFDCYETSPNNMVQPKFDCIVKLVCYYAAVSQNTDNRRVCARTEQEGVEEDENLTLERPLFCKVPTLQHLARRVINRTLTPEQQLGLRLRGAVEDYMRKYPFSL